MELIRTVGLLDLEQKKQILNIGVQSTTILANHFIMIGRPMMQ